MTMVAAFGPSGRILQDAEPVEIRFGCPPKFMLNWRNLTFHKAGAWVWG